MTPTVPIVTCPLSAVGDETEMRWCMMAAVLHRDRERRVHFAQVVLESDDPVVGDDGRALMAGIIDGSEDLIWQKQLTVRTAPAPVTHNSSGVVFLLDEIQFLERADLEALISALHQCTQRSLPVTLVGAGLPQLPALAGAAKSYAERMFEFPVIDRLAEHEARAALELPAEAEGSGLEPEATGRIVAFTDGYPYFLQEYGKHVWNLADGPIITVADVADAEPIVRLQLDDNFFRVRVARTTAMELSYISSMADLGDGPYRSGEIATRLGRPGPESVAPIRARLIEKGLIYSPSYGLNEFTVPAFADFLRRNYPPEENRRA